MTLTCLGPISRLTRLDTEGGSRANEEDLPAESAPPEQDARLPSTYEDAGGPEGAQAAPRKRAQAPHRLGAWAGILRVRFRSNGVNAFDGPRRSRASFSGELATNAGALS